MKQILCVLLLCLLLFIAIAEEFGLENPVTVSTENRSDRTTYYFNNKTPGTITAGIRFTRLVNCLPDVPLPHLLTLTPHSRTRALAVIQTDKNKRWDNFFMYSYRHGSCTARPDGTVYALPCQRGTTSRIMQGYNGKTTHQGQYAYSLDFTLAVGTSVLAARNGMVVAVQDKHEGHGLEERYRNRNNYILIEHDDGTIGEYNHLRKGSAQVRTGQRVKTGTPLARVGLVGFTAPHPHLHFCVYAPVSDSAIRTFPVRFRTAEGASLTLVEGRVYTAQ